MRINMSSSSSESEQSFDNEHSDSGSENLHMDSGDEDVLVVNSVVTLYENEPLANAADEQNFVSLTLKHLKQDSKEQLP